MKITKLGHCCMLVEENGVRVLTDPGLFTAGSHTRLKDIDIVLYTHEHADHFHIESLKAVLAENEKAIVLCNPGVGALLEKESIVHTVVGDGQLFDQGISIEGHGEVHASIHSSFPVMQNTGYFIAEHLWYPGDAFYHPGFSPAVLALPLAGPWMKLSEAVDYAIQLSPKKIFPVHDMLLNEIGLDVQYRVAGTILGNNKLEFTKLDLHTAYDF